MATGWLLTVAKSQYKAQPDLSQVQFAISFRNKMSVAVEERRISVSKNG